MKELVQKFFKKILCDLVMNHTVCIRNISRVPKTMKHMKTKFNYLKKEVEDVSKFVLGWGDFGKVFVAKKRKKRTNYVIFL